MRDCTDAAPLVVRKQMFYNGRGVYWPRVKGTVGDWSVAMFERTPQRQLVRSVTFAALSPTEIALLKHLYPMHWGVMQSQVVKTTTGEVSLEFAALYFNANALPNHELPRQLTGKALSVLNSVGV